MKDLTAGEENRLFEPSCGTTGTSLRSSSSDPRPRDLLSTPRVALFYMSEEEQEKVSGARLFATVTAEYEVTAGFEM